MLTEAQKKLVEDNYRLAYYVTRKTLSVDAMKFADLVGGYTFDDLYAETNVGLCKAAQLYDEDRGKFSSYAVPVIRNHLLTVLNNITKSKNTDGIAFRLDNNIENDNGTSKRLTYYDIVADQKHDVEKTYFKNEAKKEIKEILNNDAPYILGSVKAGSLAAYGKQLGISRERVRQRVVTEKRRLSRKYKFKDLLKDAA